MCKVCATDQIIIYGVAYTSARMFVGAITAIYLLNNGMTLMDLGFLKTWQAIVIAVIELPAAYVADKFSRKLSIILAGFFSATWLLMTGWAPNILILYVAETSNAISIALFSGTFISYLIDESKSKHPIFKSKQIIAKFNKYQFLMMGTGALVGSLAISVDSSTIWFVSGVAVIMVTVSGYIFLPNNDGSARNKTTRPVISDLLQIRDYYRKNAFELIYVILALLQILAFYQIAIQFWQPLISNAFGQFSDLGVMYGVVFVLILCSQSLAGAFCEKIESHKLIVKVAVVTSFLSILLMLISIYFLSLALIPAILLLFFSLRSFTISLGGIFHDAIESDLRSTMDSSVSALLRILLLLIMPLSGWALGKYGLLILCTLYIILIIGIVSTLYIKSRSTAQYRHSNDN